MTKRDPIDRLAEYLTTADGSYRFLHEYEHAYLHRLARETAPSRRSRVSAPSAWEIRVSARISAMRTALQAVYRHVNGGSERNWDYIGRLTMGDILDTPDAPTMSKMLHELTDETENPENGH